MTNPRNLHEVAVRPLVYETVESRSVLVTRDLPYPGSGNRELRFDLYRPAHTTLPRVPVVLLTTGFSDVGMQKRSDARRKRCSRIAPGRVSSQAPASRRSHIPTRSQRRTRTHSWNTCTGTSEAPGIDASRIGLWSCSGNVPNALSLLMTSSSAFACGAFLYGYMLDLEGSTVVADAARTWNFANPNTGRGVEDLPADVPLLVVRAGTRRHDGSQRVDRWIRDEGAGGQPIVHPPQPARGTSWLRYG